MSNFANPELENSFLKVILASNTSAAPAVVFANDLTKGLYWDINGLHLTGLSASPTDDTEAASKAYVDSQAGGGGANVNLSNLEATSINADLNLQTDIKIVLTSDEAPTQGHLLQRSDSSLIILSKDADENTAYVIADNRHEFDVAGTALGRFQVAEDATSTSLWLYDLDSGSIQQVSVGAADSGGTGFKLLRIPN